MLPKQLVTYLLDYITSVDEQSVSQLILLIFHITVIEENGVRLKLTVTDTPGFGDHINNENW